MPIQSSATTYRLHDGLLEDVHAARLERDAERLPVLAVSEAAAQHAVHDALQARVDHLRVPLTRLLGVGDSQRGVVVDTFGWRSGVGGWGDDGADAELWDKK